MNKYPAVAWVQRIILLLVALTSSAVVAAADDSDATKVYRTALDERNNLDYTAAQKTLQSWLANHPNDIQALNELAAVRLHREMFQRGILASHIYGDMGEMFGSGKIPFTPNFEKEFLQVVGKAQTLAENRIKENPDDQEALYWAGAAHATRAIFYFTMMKSYLSALRESSEARKDHAQLLKMNPNFVDAQLVIGMNDYVMGCIPWYLKVFTSIAGYRGNRSQGIQEVRQVADHGNWARDDARLVLAVLCRREKLYPETLQVLQGLAESFPQNFLIEREIAGIYETQGDLRAAAEVYDSIVAKHDGKTPGYTQMPAAKICFESGQIHDRLGDLDTALARYEEVEKLPANDYYVYRSELAAADLCVRMNRRAEAARKYTRVAAAVPNTDEGKAARRALKKLHGTADIRAGGQ